MAYLLAASAAFVNALTSVLQRIGVETAPESTTMRLSLMRHAIKRGIWLIGFALMLVVFGLQATALRFGQLSVVQPVLTTELLFLLLILGVWFRYRLGWKEWLGSLTIVAGLGGFFLAAAPKGGNAVPTNHQWLVASVLLLAAIAGFIVAALRGPRWWRAASFGAATAVTAAYTASLTKAITTYTTEGWGHVLTHFQPYMLAVCGLGTVFLLQNALHAGPITASRTTLVPSTPSSASCSASPCSPTASGEGWAGSASSWPPWACWWPGWWSWPAPPWWPGPPRPATSTRCWGAPGTGPRPRPVLPTPRPLRRPGAGRSPSPGDPWSTPSPGRGRRDGPTPSGGTRLSRSAPRPGPGRRGPPPTRRARWRSGRGPVTGPDPARRHRVGSAWPGTARR